MGKRSLRTKRIRRNTRKNTRKNTLRRRNIRRRTVKRKNTRRRNKLRKTIQKGGGIVNRRFEVWNKGGVEAKDSPIARFTADINVSETEWVDGLSVLRGIVGKSVKNILEALKKELDYEYTEDQVKVLISDALAGGHTRSITLKEFCKNVWYQKPDGGEPTALEVTTPPPTGQVNPIRVRGKKEEEEVEKNVTRIVPKKVVGVTPAGRGLRSDGFSVGD